MSHNPHLVAPVVPPDPLPAHPLSPSSRKTQRENEHAQANQAAANANENAQPGGQGGGPP